MENVVIVGAGPAGLTAAYHLLKKGNNRYKVTVLEKSDLVGGISKSISFNGYTVDTGIHRYFSKNDQVNNIWEELIPIQNKLSYDQMLCNSKVKFKKKGSDPEIDDKSFLIKERKTRIFYENNFYDYPLSISKKTLQNIGFFRLIECSFSYLKAVVFKKKETSLENFYINQFGKKLYQMFFEDYTEKVWGIHPKNISADWGAQRTKGLSIFSLVFDIIKRKMKLKNNKNSKVSLIEKFYYPKLGSGQMWNVMKDEIIAMGGRVILSSNINHILFNNGKISEIEYLKDKSIKKLKCDKLISSMPIKDLITLINEEKKVPSNVYDAAINLPYREFMSVCLVLKRINWVNDTKKKNVQNIPFDSWIYIQNPTVKLGRIQIFNNWSPYIFNKKEECKENILIGLEYFCSENDDFWNMEDKDFINYAIDEIIKIKLISSKNDVISSRRIKIKKAYPAYFGSYNRIGNIKEYLDSIENLYCIGRNGQHRYNNMDHAMLTGIKVASNIINNIKKKDNIWNVNTEKSYHEIKNRK